MDEEFVPENDDVNTVLVQESSELLHILLRESPAVIAQLCHMMPGEVGQHNTNVPTPSSTLVDQDRIKAVLEYFSLASPAECCSFIQSVCLLCQNIPLHLETRLMSVAGSAHGVSENTCAFAVDQSSLSPQAELQLTKRRRIDHWGYYVAAAVCLLSRRWERISEHVVKKVQLEDVWVSQRTTNKSKERADQTPRAADRGSRTPESDVEYGSFESTMTLETFLQGLAGKVTILTGPAGSGKTLLMSRLGQQWANGLGPVAPSYLFVLLEFRQLNLLSSPVSLSDLLFQHYLRPEGGDSAQVAILDYLISNPEQSCWVLDGYDEFDEKLHCKAVRREPVLLHNRLPVADLISGLLHRRLLPGSTVLVTCRLQDVVDLDGVSDKVGQLLEWDRHEIKDYVETFFNARDSDLGTQALDLLFSNQHLLTLSSLPVLCNICCICLEQFLLGQKVAEEMRSQKEEQSLPRKTAFGEIEEEEEVSILVESRSSHLRQGNEERMMESPTPPTIAQVPTTLTQVYLTFLGSYLSRDQRKSYAQTKTITFPHSNVCTSAILSQYRFELHELSHLAWRGVEDNKILLMEEEIPKGVLEFSIRTGLLLQVELRDQEGNLVNAYCFIHRSVQEFLASLKNMISDDVSEAQLRKRFNLKSRWMTKSDQKTKFAGSLYLYMCGLASSQCTSALVQITWDLDVQGVEGWVQKRQAFILKLLRTFCQQNNLTGPKMLEICHCVQESQDKELATVFMNTRPTLEFRKIRILPKDIDALVFVVNSGGENGISLDFGACSMDLECLDVLSKCQYINHLSFHSRKYEDKFAEKLSSVLPAFRTLKKLEFRGTSLTAEGAASLASALQKCPLIREINLSDNNLGDEGVKHITTVFTKLQNLTSVKLGQNSTSFKAINNLIDNVSLCKNIQHVQADEMNEVTVTFLQVSASYEQPAPTISLLNQTWRKMEMVQLARSLVGCPALSTLNLSGATWNNDTLKTLVQFLPKFNITEKIVMNDSCLSVQHLVILTALLPGCSQVTELLVRSPAQVCIRFSGEMKIQKKKNSQVLCLSNCNLKPANLRSVWNSLGPSPALTVLDLSHNSLGNKGLKNVLDILPHLCIIQEINASNNEITMEGVVMLAGILCSNDTNLTQIYISGGGQDQVILKFGADKSHDKEDLKMFRINSSNLQPADVATVCRKLTPCHQSLALELSQCSLNHIAIEHLLKQLPKMTSLQRLDISRSINSTADALKLLNFFTKNPKVTSVELGSQIESIINFSKIKSEPLFFRMTHFILNGDNLAILLNILHEGPRLSALNLSSNQLGDEGVKTVVKSLPKLQISSYVDVGDNMLTQQGVMDVANTLCSCTGVSDVDVSLEEDGKCLIWFRPNPDFENTLSIRGSRLQLDHLLTLSRIVSDCPTLTRVVLINNSLQFEWIQDFVKLLNCSRRELCVSIEEGWIRAEKAAGLLCSCLVVNSSIQTIRIYQTTLHLTLKSPSAVIADRFTDSAQSLAIEKIGLVDCGVDVHQLASMKNIIQHCSSLTEFEFSDNGLCINGVETICSFLPFLPKLTTLSIASKEHAATVVDMLLQTLQTSPSVQCINLSGHEFNDPAAPSLTALLPRLQSLNLSRCTWSEAAVQQFIKALGQCVRLETLCMEFVHLNEESKVHLIQKLQNINSIRCLRLDGWRMADRGAEELITQLQRWRELRKIMLSENLISDQSGVQLLKALQSCVHLEELNLSRNQLGNGTAAQMAVVLPSVTHLSVLDMSENPIGDKGSVSLAKGIAKSKNLSKLYLTSVGTSELRAITASLARCPLIQELSLGWNSCGDEVALELSRVLPLCHRLTRIDLENNMVTVSGAEALLRALKCHPALQIIRLWKNEISKIDAQRLHLRDKRLNFSSI
ncbi:protein NLRC5 isoform X2 [Gouania willdenowi]|uniref:protein NLRC5 isoform X2 n=1 Tax=Gouania willdenowi TaxID=441366 RepID=UPI00105453C8|nr:protein NLRC5 isoform X2 [Gouania willdenowi]